MSSLSDVIEFDTMTVPKDASDFTTNDSSIGGDDQLVHTERSRICLTWSEDEVRQVGRHGRWSLVRDDSAGTGDFANSPLRARSLQLRLDENETHLDLAPSMSSGQGAKNRAMLVVLGGFAGLFASFGWIISSGLFQDYYAEHQLEGYQPATIAWINSTGFCLMYFASPLVGKLTMMYGPRAIILFGTTLHLGGLIAASFSTKYWQLFLAQGVCSPLGAGAIFFTSVTTMALWFSKRSPSLVIGISAAGASVGGVVFPTMVNKLLPQIGFAWTMRSAALLILVLLIVANMSSRMPLGVTPREDKEDIPVNFVSHFKDKVFTTTMAACTVLVVGYFVTMDFVVIMARQRGMSLPIYALVILNGSSFFGRIFPGLVADHIGRYNTTIIMSTFSGVATLALWYPFTSLSATYAFSAVYGFASGSIVSLIPSCILQISDPEQYGLRLSLVYMFMSFVALTAGPIGGALITWDAGAGQYLQIFCGTVQLAAVPLFGLARVQQGCLGLMAYV